MPRSTPLAVLTCVSTLLVAASALAAHGEGTFGYRYDDEVEVGGPVYSWTDISATGTNLGLSNNSSGTASLPFTFTLYDRSVTTVYPSANGAISLDNGTFNAGNACLPTGSFGSGVTGYAILGLWDDWNPTGIAEAGVFWQVLETSPRQAVFQWEKVKTQSGALITYVNFQIILEETTNRILFQYEDAGTGFAANGVGATIGIARGTSDYLSYSCNTASIATNRVIRFQSCTDVDGDLDGYTDCTDCDDTNPAVSPAMAPDCSDGLDTNCDGIVEEADGDLDGVTECAGDCDDTDATVYPDAPELCDAIDNNCDTFVDEMVDEDADGFTACQGDCDDTDASRFPTQLEGCDLIDNDCDGVVDDGWDADADGYTSCAGDCNDSDDAVNPGAIELCDSQDSDCDGVPADFEFDNDGDGFIGCDDGDTDADCDDADDTIYPGAAEVCGDGIDSDCEDDLENEEDNDGDGVSECDDPTDCNDNDPAIYPGAVEICDNKNNDCNSATDEDGDIDGDTFTLCDGDCDDYDAGSNPTATETCDGDDNDCNGDVDDGIDADEDGFSGCNGIDCDDHEDDIYPGASDYPYNGVDEDCSGADTNDLDADGYVGGPTGVDCQDQNAAVHPDAEEVCDDGIDNECDYLADAGDPDCQGGDDGGGACSGCGASVGGASSPRGVLALVSVALAMVVTRRRRGTSPPA